MTTYPLYLESGPKRQTTMVHVFDLLGCNVSGPTTEAALDATPDAIRAYLAFLQQHGEAADPAAPFDTTVAQHVTEGPRIGYGDPQPGFEPDFVAVTADELAVYLQRFRWLGQAIADRLAAAPAGLLALESGDERTLRAIGQHLSEAQGYYLRYLTGKIEGLPQAQHAVREAADVAAALGEVWRLNAERFAALTPRECGIQVHHGQVSWTARRALRRSLEHAWEHLREIEARLS